MTLSELLQILKEAPLVASVQASPGSPVNDPETLLKLAQASLENGVKVLRLEGEVNIRHIKGRTGAPTIGLIKRQYPGSEVYITPTRAEVETLLDLGVEVVALDATERRRPDGAKLGDLVEMVHRAGRLAMADCDHLANAQDAANLGFDLIGTTLSGYTANARKSNAPDLEMVRQLLPLKVPVIAEGRYSSAEDVRAAIRIGAAAVVVGGALNDPVKQTRAFVNAVTTPPQVGAVDIGGTWLRFATVTPDAVVANRQQIPLPRSRQERLEWIEARCAESGVTRLGIGTGGTVDYRTNTVWEAKPLIPDHEGTTFAFDDIEVIALNDGLATGWGHAMHRFFAGSRVATLALGTGVGCSVVDRGRILMGPRGEYPRINDFLMPDGRSIESILGGAALDATGTSAGSAEAIQAAQYACDLIDQLYHPDQIVLCGGVGLSPWLRVAPGRVYRSPYLEDAGLVGAGMLALYPPTK